MVQRTENIRTDINELDEKREHMQVVFFLLKKAAVSQGISRVEIQHGTRQVPERG